MKCKSCKHWESRKRRCAKSWCQTAAWDACDKYEPIK